MKKVVMPAICTGYTGTGKKVDCDAFCKIEYTDDGKLSISGVIGPLKSGNCRGSAGQCVDEIRLGRPAAKWNRQMLVKFCDIWDRWHLNDMRAYCEHQRELGWLEEGKEYVTLSHYILTEEVEKAKKAAEKAALEHLRAGKTFTPTKEQTFYANLDVFLDTYNDLDDVQKTIYKPYKSSFRTDFELKKRYHISYDETPKGILGKPCPVCGYKYGTKWLKEEVPKDVIDWLFALPDTPKQPAWV